MGIAGKVPGSLLGRAEDWVPREQWRRGWGKPRTFVGGESGAGSLANPDPEGDGVGTWLSWVVAQSLGHGSWHGIKGQRAELSGRKC